MTKIIAYLPLGVALLALWFSYRAIPLSPARLVVQKAPPIDLIAFPRIFSPIIPVPIEHYFITSPGLRSGRVRVDSVYMTLITIENRGAQSFLWDRFTQPLTFFISQRDRQFLSAQPTRLGQSRDVSVSVEIDQSYNTFSVSADYLNSREKINLVVFHEDLDDRFEIKSSIVDHPPLVLRDGMKPWLLNSDAYKRLSKTSWAVAGMFFLIISMWRWKLLSLPLTEAVRYSVHLSTFGPMSSVLLFVLYWWKVGVPSVQNLDHWFQTLLIYFALVILMTLFSLKCIQYDGKQMVRSGLRFIGRFY